MNALTPIAGKLAKLLRMLSSNREPEVLAAAQALCRTLQSAGADIHALATIVEHGGELNQAEMKKLYDAGYHEGLRVAEDKHHGSEDFRNIDGLPSWHEMALWCQHRGDRLQSIESVNSSITWLRSPCGASLRRSRQNGSRASTTSSAVNAHDQQTSNPQRRSDTPAAGLAAADRTGALGGVGLGNAKNQERRKVDEATTPGAQPEPQCALE
jgi:hypothetical protein